MDSNAIAWTSELATGDSKIDEQHRTLIELIAAVPQSISPECEGILARALEYAETHFAAEEALMKKFDYPDIEAHKRGHKRLLRTLLSYKREFDEGERDIYSLKGFMYNWVRDHIQDEDRRIGDHIRAGREKQAELAGAAD